jgi:hypothetical protein
VVVGTKNNDTQETREFTQIRAFVRIKTLCLVCVVYYDSLG